MKATKRLIASVWTLEYEVVEENKIKILNYTRTDKEGYDLEQKLPQCELIETDNRIVTHVLFKPFKNGEWVNRENATEIFEVVNPQYIFSYESTK